MFCIVYHYNCMWTYCDPYNCKYLGTTNLHGSVMADVADGKQIIVDSRIKQETDASKLFASRSERIL